MAVQVRCIQSYGAGRMPQKRVLEELFDTATPSKWAMPSSRQNQDNKQQKGKAAGDQHDSSTGKAKAVLTKDGDYKRNFSGYINTDSSRKAVYNKISPNVGLLHGKSRPLIASLFEDHFKIDTYECNFNYSAVLQRVDNVKGKRKTAGCSKPYNWEAHHLIPGEAFTVMEATKGKKEEIFTPTQYQLLLMSDYDINHGHNIIALPSNAMDFFQPVHNLIQHPSNHQEYTSRVIKEMKLIKRSLKEAEEELGEDHPKISVAIANSLRDKGQTEDKLWKLLVKLGEAIVTEKVTKIDANLSDEDRNLVKYEAATTGTQYEYGALS